MGNTREEEKARKLSPYSSVTDLYNASVAVHKALNSAIHISLLVCIMFVTLPIQIKNRIVL